MHNVQRAVALFLAFTLAPFAANAQKRPMTEKDLFDFVWIGDTQIAPDGRSLVFVQTTCTPDHSTYQTSLYWLDLTTSGAKPELLTPGTHDSAPPLVARRHADRLLTLCRTPRRSRRRRWRRTGLPDARAHIREARRQGHQDLRTPPRRRRPTVDARRQRPSSSAPPLRRIRRPPAPTPPGSAAPPATTPTSQTSA